MPHKNQGPVKQLKFHSANIRTKQLKDIIENLSFFVFQNPSSAARVSQYYIFVRYIELYINAKKTSIKPLRITYTGTLKSKNTNIPLLNSPTVKTSQESVLSTTELRSCFDDTPNANIKGMPNVTTAPIVTTHCTRSKLHIS